MNTITNSIVATFSVTPELYEPEFDKDFASIQHLRDYCDYEFGHVHLESFCVNGACYESLEDYDDQVADGRHQAFLDSGFESRAEFDEWLDEGLRLAEEEGEDARRQFLRHLKG